MPREQTALERIKFFMNGPSTEANYLIPHFPDEGQNNGFFVNRTVQLVSVAVRDLQELIDLLENNESRGS
jgi:hypothetical protein